MSKKARAAMRAYNADLLERVCKVKCPRCGAKKGQRCIGQYNREHASTHWARNNEAKRQGYVGGRWFDCEKYGVTA